MNDAAVAEVERRGADWMPPASGMRPDSVNLTIDRVEPDSVTPGQDVQLTVYGKGVPYDGQAFVPGCAVYVGGDQLVTTWVDENTVTAILPGSRTRGRAVSTTTDVVVRNPSAITSEPVQLTISAGAVMVYGFDAGVGAPTGPGQVRFESADQANPGTIWITSVDANGGDNGDALGSMPIPGVVRLEDQADPAAWQEYVYQGRAVVTDGYALTMPIHWNAGAPLVAGAMVVATFRPYS